MSENPPELSSEQQQLQPEPGPVGQEPVHEPDSVPSVDESADAEEVEDEVEPPHSNYDEDVPEDAEPDFDAPETNPKVAASDG